MLDVTDDSGFLAVLVPSAYDGFVAEQWELHQLFRHFTAKMAERSLLIWGTGLEGPWRIDVRLQPSGISGFREVVGSIQVSGGAVLITNYESLTMAAQFQDVRLPEPHEQGHLVALPDGAYLCRVIQMFDPENASSAGADGPDFVLEFRRTETPAPAWAEVPWLKP